ncbi:MAG TPA: asparaginase [Thermomicrobiales bacterium]|jgi:L-asparaginase II|nr:asparaginase [Thermomicrobiales bacterium]
MTVIAEITRGALVESSHLGSVAIVDTDATMVAWAGDPEKRLFFRSSAKAFQGIPLVASGAADAYGFTTEELALATASHNATGRHQAVVASMLAKAGLRETDLQCGTAPPLDEDEKAKVTLGLTPPTLIQCECSGKHAGMLATCRHQGWPIETYLDLDHPLQREIRAIVAGACGVPDDTLDIATDGCSLPTFGAPLRAFATAYAVLADPYDASWERPRHDRAALDRLREAIVKHPELVSGNGEIDTTVMRVTGGKVVAKLGAEGLLCMAVPERRLGIAITDSGGSTRSLGPGAVAVLGELELVDQDTLMVLREKLCPPVTNFAGKSVGETRAVLQLERR